MVAFATQVKRRRGTTAQNDAFTGAEGEIVVDTERHELRVHDGVTMGGFKIGGGTSLPLLTPIWSDHKLNDASYLNADTFSWQSGAVYEAAYKHLVDDFNAAVSDESNHVLDSNGVRSWVCQDGHRIIHVSDITQVENTETVYESTGVAWYYILDTENARFKLPRSKHNKYSTNMPVYGRTQTLFSASGTSAPLFASGTMASGIVAVGGHQTNRSATSDIKQIVDAYAENTEDTDQYKYLYFYVGNFTETAVENTAGLNAELFNNKADLNLMNTAANVDFVIESQEPTAENGYTWYRLYKSGWIEQGGRATTNSGNPCAVALPVEMADVYYNISILGQTEADGYNKAQWQVMSISTASTSKSTTGFYGQPSITGYSLFFYWEVRGMSAQ